MIEIVDKILLKIIRKLSKIHCYLLSKYENVKKWNFKYMIPEKNAKNIKTYEEFLLEALRKNREVKNIAVTGDYGSGKSSFLKSFEYKYPECNFLDISLATFDEIKNNETKKDISIIEKSILEQIFYREPYDKIPQSRFKKINSHKWIFLQINTILTILTLFSILFLLKPKFITELHIYQIFIKYHLEEFEYSAIGVLLVVLYFVIRYFVKNFNGFVLEKFNLQNMEIQTNKEIDETSLLNKYLDEILYFFEKTDYKIVVFQDLDRFEKSEIFIKLRELNRLINNSKQINKRIVFIYVLKDEIFKDEKERVKFFDAIIPIIPYVNTKTSFDTLSEYFKTELKEEEKMENFLKDISIYIYDMRLLKNIYNEYKVFKLQIGKGLDKTKLLAMIIYKNFDPQDYSKLHKSESVINGIISKKYEYIKKEIELKEGKIIELKKDLDNNIDVQELKKIYIYEIITELNINEYLYLDNIRISISKAIDDDNFNKIKNSNNLKKDNNYYNNSISFKDIEKKVDSNLTYDEREELILSKTNKKIIQLENEIDELKSETENYKLKNILEKISINNDLEEKLKDKELLKYFLLNGYIDEDYYLFISYDMKNVLTPNDTQFLKAVKINKELGFDFKINNIKTLITYLNNNDFSKNGILNTYLLEFILNDKKNKYKTQKHLFFKLLSFDSERVKKFIVYCADNLLNKSKFFNLIVKYNPNVWEIIETFCEEEKLYIYCWDIFYLADYEDILKLKSFKEYFENESYIQEFNENGREKVKKYIKDNNIKFRNLNSIRDIIISNFILENNYYELSEKMINNMIFIHCVSKNKLNVENDLKIKHYSTIKTNKLFNKKSAETLLNYINENINEYIKNVFLNIETNTKESEESIVELLNNKEIENELKYQIIKKEENKISNLSDVKDVSLWKILLENNKVLATWQNVGHYYKKVKKIDEYLFNFLNNSTNSEELSKIKIDDEFCEKYEFNKNILDDIILSNEFNNQNYKLLLENNPYWYENIDIENLDNEKIKILIETKKFQITQENLKNLTNKNLHIEFILKNIDEFFKNLDNLFSILSKEDYIKILKDEKIDIEKKISFIEKISLNNYNEELSNIIYEIFTKNNKKLDILLLDELFKYLDFDKKFDCLITQLNLNEKLNCEEIDKLLNNFDSPYNELCKKSNYPLYLKNNNENRKFLDILESKNCISSYPPNKKNKNELIIYRKKK